MADAAERVRIDRPCKLQFTIDSILNTAALPEPFSICVQTRGACASSSFTRPKAKGKPDPKNPAIEPLTLQCNVWWRPTAARFACRDGAAAPDAFPEGDAALGAGQWQLPQAVECAGRANGPDCDFSLDLCAANGSGDAVVSISGKVCALWDEEFCEGAVCVGEAMDEMMCGAIAESEDKRLHALAAELSASVSLMHCLSTIDLLNAAHEAPRCLPPPRR